MAKTTHYNLNKPAVTDVGNVSELNENADILDSELYSRVKSWNGLTPDENGNVQANTIPLADNLTSTYNTTNEGRFIIRTTSGASSVNEGQTGTLESILGEMDRIGYVPYSITLTVNKAARGEGEGDIDVYKDDATIIENSSGGTITLTYDTNEWTASPAPTGGADPLAFYGLTVVGTPKTGDEIVIVYTETVLGTIFPATPTGFVSTGWNLYNNQTQCARVAAYSDGAYSNRYKIVGAKTSVKFSYTEDGAKTTITPDMNGNFTIPDTGYVWVAGGDSTTTAIWATWGDWENNYVGEFKPYEENVIDISSVMASYFPDGMMAVGNYHDEINLSTGQVFQRIERWENTDETMEDAVSSGQPFEYDDDYIYIVKTSVSPVGISIDNTYQMNDHGTELFSGTSVAVTSRTIYGTNLKNKLERDVLTISAQVLSSEQKAQVQNNLGVSQSVMKYNTPVNIPSANGNTGNIAFVGLTDKHELIRWNFSSSSENNPPADLTWETGADYFKISNTGGSTNETIKPVFALPTV